MAARTSFHLLRCASTLATRGAYCSSTTCSDGHGHGHDHGYGHGRGHRHGHGRCRWGSWVTCSGVQCNGVSILSGSSLIQGAILQTSEPHDSTRLERHTKKSVWIAKEGTDFERSEDFRPIPFSKSRRSAKRAHQSASFQTYHAQCEKKARPAPRR